jgi:LysR family transcriptional regulator, hydrogen peroxide-inducible genes activator
MTLTELRYIVNLDKERHFGRAAERSFVSQPTLSVAVKKLEDELGVILFERTRGEIKTTDVGARIVAQARRVLAEAQRVDELAREGKDELAGPLRLGAIYTVAPYLLPGLVPVLHKVAPAMPLVIEENFTAKLLEQLRDSELDVIVVALPVDLTGLAAWPLYAEDFVAVLPAQHRWAGKTSIASRQLAEENLLLLGAGHCFRDQVIEACPKCIASDDEMPRAMTGSSLETIRYMVASGLGITVAPRAAMANRDSNNGLCVLDLDDPRPQRQVGMLFRRGYPRMQALRVLREAIRASGMQGVQWLDGASAGESAAS